jgi:hypothetical protein
MKWILAVVVLPLLSLETCGGIEWGQVFPGLVSNVLLDVDDKCAVNGSPMCCGIDNYIQRSNHSHKAHVKQPHIGMHCKHKKTYIPSPYETDQYNKAKELAEKYPKFEDRRDKYLEFITSPTEVEASKIWLERVRVRMKYGDETNEEDHQYLSRFRVTIECSNVNGGTIQPLVEESYEWIEPFTIHFRHPFSFEDLKNYNHLLQHPYDFAGIYGKLNITTHVSLMNNDFVLLQSDAGRMKTNSGKSYMLDAGSSRFDSSLYWFVCGYLQRALKFDHFFAWEYTLLEPRDYWSHVPDGIKPILTFFNIPITN